jgi:hypothetical protein
MIRATGNFVEEIILSRKNAAASISSACGKLRDVMITKGAGNFHKSNDMDKENHHSHVGGDTDFLHSPRVSTHISAQDKSDSGPLLFPGSTLHRALEALDRYHTSVSEGESRRWRMASTNAGGDRGVGVLPEISCAAMKAKERTNRREKTLMASAESMAEAESNLNAQKSRGVKYWNKVEAAESEVRRRVAEIVRQRSRERELRRKEEANAKEAAVSDVKLESTVTNQEIWELVAKVGQMGEDFAPTNLPTPSFHGPLDQTLSGSASQSFDRASPEKEDPLQAAQVAAEIDDYRVVVENELGLNELRKAAILNDEKVQDTAGLLLNVISSTDTTKRSARVAAEATLLSAANAQVKCLKSLVELEKESIKERLRLLEAFEKTISEVDVRSDLNTFVEHEIDELPNGASKIGINDDGGLASALAVLNAHGEGIGVGIGVAGMAELSTFSGWKDEEEEQMVYDREELDDAVGVLFNSKLSDPEEKQSFEESVQLLTRAVKEKSTRARGYRASTCYAMNNFRGKVSQLDSEEQFDGLCTVLSSLLDGCDRESADVASAKMVMMLAQTFYIIKDEDTNSEDRTKRIYPKDRLSSHAIWLDEDFWVQALFQCVTDSLSNSGVMVRVRVRKNAANKGSKMRWHDLRPSDRENAASQVHAVIFAQLGALAHSMVEFGCSVEKACHFVRRLSVRHQLPLNQRALLLQHLRRKVASIDRSEI